MKYFYAFILFFVFYASGQEFRITNDQYFDTDPVVDPFTNEIYYQAVRLWEHGIFKIPIQGGSPILTNFDNIPSFFFTEHKAAYISYEDSLILYDFNSNIKNSLTVFNNTTHNLLSISPNEEKLFHGQKAPSYYSFLDSSYHDLPISPFAPQGYSRPRIQWRDDNNVIYKEYYSAFDTLIINYNYNTSQSDTLLNLNISYASIDGIAYNPIYNLLAYSYHTPSIPTNVGLLNLNTMQDTLILIPDTSTTFYPVYIRDMAWSKSGKKLAMAGNNATVPDGDIYLYNLLENKLDTLTQYPATNDGLKNEIVWFNEDTLIYSKYVYQIDRWQIFGFSTLPLLDIDEPDINIISGFEVYQNYPNPFNNSTKITYVSTQSGSAQLVIYDVLGREIYQYSEKCPLASVQSFVWNGKNILNHEVSSGIYFYQINFTSAFKQESSAFNKMVYIK